MTGDHERSAVTPGNFEEAGGRVTQQSNPRKLALITGVFFVVTFITSIGAAILYIPVLKAGYITGGGADTRVLLGALFEVFLIIANIGSAVALFPILKSQSLTFHMSGSCASAMPERPHPIWS